jgi:hypothetical protein
MANIKVNLQIDEKTPDFYVSGDQKASAGMRNTLETVARFGEKHPVIEACPSLESGVEYIFEWSKMIFRDSLIQIKGIFSKNELVLIVAALNSTMVSPRYAGKMFVSGISDSIDLDGYDSLYEVDKTEIIEKLKKLNDTELATLELWANGFWYGKNELELDEYIKTLL